MTFPQSFNDDSELCPSQYNLFVHQIAKIKSKNDARVAGQFAPDKFALLLVCLLSGKHEHQRFVTVTTLRHCINELE